jgi:glucose dehydrogenase
VFAADFATLDARLIALDAETGKPCPGFGVHEPSISLKVLKASSIPGTDIFSTAVGNSVIVGSSIVDIIRRIQPSGAVRDRCANGLAQMALQHDPQVR